MSIQSEINRIAGAKSDIADAIEDKGVTVPSGTKLDGMANLIGQISSGSEKLNSTQAADAYDPTATYAVGDKVSYAGNVYSCISAISTPEAWDSTHWDQVDPIQDQVDEVRNTLNYKADVIYDTASGDIASFPDGADGLPVKDLTVGIEPVQDTSGGDPSPTHICPISGWTGANVTRTGFNVWDEEWENGYLGYHDYDMGQPIDATTVRTKNFISVIPGTTYFMKRTYTGSTYIWFYDLNKNGISFVNINTSNNVFTIPDNIYFIKFVLESVYGTTYNHDICINLSDPAKNGTYEPGHVVTLPISWQSEAGTVYGGTLDMTTGVLTVDRAIVSALSDNVQEGTDGDNDWLNVVIRADIAMLTPTGNISKWEQMSASNYSGRYKYQNVNGTIHYYNSSSVLCVFYPKTSFPTLQDFISYNETTPATFVVLLANPVTYQLTPEEVITTLLGQNNIWADCGPSAVEYPCDTKLYIERLTAPEEDDMIANQNIASGVYFMVGNNLYLSTAAILAGDPIKPGTNCTLTNLAAALNALNS